MLGESMDRFEGVLGFLYWYPRGHSGGTFGSLWWYPGGHFGSTLGSLGLIFGHLGGTLGVH